MGENLEPDEILLLNRYRKTKRERHGGGEWAIKDGNLVMLHTTDKADLNAELERVRRLREVGGNSPS